MENKKPTNKKLREVAIIFKTKLKDRAVIFEPKYLVTGYLDERKKKFIDTDTGVEYDYLLPLKANNYVFGLRTTIKELNKLKITFGIDSTHNLLKYYLKEAQQSTFFFNISPDNVLSFMSEDKKTKEIMIENERDLALGEEIDEEAKTEEKIDPFKDVLHLPPKIKQHIIGQDDQIDELISILWRNSQKENKENVALIGPTGVGKTEIVRTIAKVLDLPVTIIDVSDFTKTGYHGEGVPDIFKKVLANCNYDLTKVEKSIVVLDEFDKLARKNNSSDTVTSSGVQQELLKPLEDGEYLIEIPTGPDTVQTVSLNTKGMTFIMAGAFQDLFNNHNKPHNNIGFITSEEKPKKNTGKLPEVNSEVLVKYGIIPELVGRIHNFIVLNPLTEENLITIMKNPESHILNEDIKFFNNMGYKVHITDAAYSKIAKISLQKKLGARGLVGTISNVLKQASYDAKRHEGKYNYLEITEETVDNPKKYILKKQ